VLLGNDLVENISLNDDDISIAEGFYIITFVKSEGREPSFV
jgi:hypothetical protein